MANPAPTINQINAFNATQGTIIDFNIIGGTELVRSNRIYIYDLSDNSLICTHLYVSTESIHELPANTDSSIVYESGKSSADFVNGAQYYAQIQTYTDTAGTEGGSGLSVAKMFWCLVDPTLTITTIPSTISTTSYNVSATYNANTSVVSNIIQQYQFNLYSATGSLLQSSGVVVGSGTQQGTSTAYDISYNFTGLSVGSSYYVVVDITTTQGMNVSTQSNTFTVSIDTPTLGEATVVNNACDGYISVTSNLSGEYGGSASGEIASFVTNSVNDVSSLKVTLTPQQDGTPWISTESDTTPYLTRSMPDVGNAYNREDLKVVGGTVGWNQLMSVNSAIATYTKLGVTLTRASNEPKWTINGTFGRTAGDKNFYVYSGTPISFLKNHVYVLTTTSNYFKIYTYGVLSNARNFSVVVKASDNGTGSWSFNANDIEAGTAINETASVNVFDLTAMFGSTIADYIYSLEQATAGAGVEWFRRYFPEEYYPYSANTLQSVQATAHKTYDGDGNVIGNYALDSSIILRGIPKLDNGNLYYDGDTYESDGTVTRKWTEVTLDGSSDESWATASTCTIDGTTYKSVGITIGDIKTNGIRSNVICNKFVFIGKSNMSGNYQCRNVYWNNRNFEILVMECTNLEEYRTWLSNNPITVAYGLATQTTETAQSYTNPQVVDPDGTEEFVTANSVPVGQETRYSLVCPISGYDEVGVSVNGVNQWDEEYQNGYWSTSDGTYHSSSGQLCSKNYIEVVPNTAYYYYKGGGSTNGEVLYFDANKAFISSGGQRGNQGFTTPSNCRFIQFNVGNSYGATYNNDISINYPSTDHEYHPYQGNTYTATLPETVYGGTLDVVSGVLTVDRAIVTLDGSATSPRFGEVSQATTADGTLYVAYINHTAFGMANNDVKTMSDKYAFKNLQLNNLHIGEFNAKSTYSRFVLSDQSITTLNALNAYLADNPIQLVYELATTRTIQLTPQQIQTLVGMNNVWGSGSVEITYNIPITNLLVKRQDVADVSGTWLTLHSQPITQASDMDFTFIDFLNQYGKTYKYALVPLLTQTQSGVEVEVEGGYTVSDEVQSVFDGVFIADSTGLQKCKANVGYGDVDMNQAVGTITPIGAKYPVVITNSKNQYHTGSIFGTIVPDDYYFNGNLSRIDMVNKRNELEQFLTNKRAKIIKDWNSNIWLVMITENINCTFNNEYGMGIVNFTANWIEVGDPTNQQDLQAAGLIDVGGV